MRTGITQVSLLQTNQCCQYCRFQKTGQTYSWFSPHLSPIFSLADKRPSRSLRLCLPISSRHPLKLADLRASSQCTIRSSPRIEARRNSRNSNTSRRPKRSLQIRRHSSSRVSRRRRTNSRSGSSVRSNGAAVFETESVAVGTAACVPLRGAGLGPHGEVFDRNVGAGGSVCADDFYGTAG